MIIDKVLPFAQKLLNSAVGSGDIAVDATVGNGHDTVYLAELVGPDGRVFGFDIQKEAITAAVELLNEHQVLERVTLVHDGHEHLQEHIPFNLHGKVAGVIFNLGYLPGGDKTITTKPETTIAAVEQLLEIIAPEGVIVLVIYHGHAGGAKEKDALIQFCENLDQQLFHVLKYQFINQENHPPFMIAIEKKIT